jgi:hypothetical protein
MGLRAGLPDGIFEYQKYQFGYFLEGLGMDIVGIFCAHLKYLQLFGLFCAHLVYFSSFWCDVPRSIWQA